MHIAMCVRVDTNHIVSIVVLCKGWCILCSPRRQSGEEEARARSVAFLSSGT